MNPIPELVPYLKQLRLSGILDSLEARNRQALDGKLAYTEFLALLIEDEVARREQKKFALRLRRAAFRASKTIEQFDFERLPLEEMRARAAAWYAELSRRRTTRDFSTEPVPRDLIELAIRCAGTAPSGAHRQPWTYVAVGDPELKRRIRAAAEDEERRTYTERMPDEWRRALAPLGTDWVKSHITDAPWVVVVVPDFGQMFQPDPLIEAIPWVSAFLLAAGGVYWIQRIVKDIEDN